ncbi:Ig-like domain-containing protein [Niallia sp. 01092]|uniref:Ig-like domain-containing protein n=1 Tax=unclassified Niallia TaxID=2837522 RepID=UPI003FD4F458
MKKLLSIAICSLIAISLFNGANQAFAEPLTTDKDVTAPAPPQVNKTTNKSTEVTGQTEAGSTIVIKNDQNEQLGTDTAKNTGEFSVAIPKLKPGTKIIVTATDSANNTSYPTISYIFPTTLNFNTITDQTTIMQGTTTPNTFVIVSSDDNQWIGRSKDDGSYIVTLPLFKADTKLNISSLDIDSGLRSDVISVTVQDVTPPEMPKVDAVTDHSKVIKGKTEPGAQVYLVTADDFFSVTAGHDGKFSVDIPVQKLGSFIYVNATDTVGNQSDSIEVKVTEAVPVKINSVTNKETSLTGKTVKGATVTVSISGKNYTAKANPKDGSFSVKIPVQNAGKKISVYAKDKANIKSLTKTTTVKRTAPNMPSVNKVKNTSTSVSGAAEKKAKITIKIGKKSYKGTVDSKGKFKVKIPKQKTGTKIYVSAADSKNKTSVAKTVTVVK